MKFEGCYSQTSHRLIADQLTADGSEAWQVHERACEMHAQDKAVILLSVGDPDLPTLDRIIDCAINSLKGGRTHYSPGMGEYGLRQIIAEIEVKASGKPTSPDDIVIFPGATNAIYTVMSCLLDRGDEVVVPEPMYVGYQGIFRAIGANIVGVPSDLHNRFAIDLAAIKKAINPKTKVVFVNTPGNPAGNIIPAEDLKTLAKYCLSKGVWLVCDEVYSMITFDKPHVSLRKAAERLDNVVIIDGLSKSHAMTGWRMGWTVAPENLTRHLLSFTSSTIFGCCQFVQDAAAYALQNDEEYIAQIVQEYRARRDYVCQRLDAMSKLKCQPPEAGMFVMIDVSGAMENGFVFANRLLAQEKVSVLPGESFGAVTKHFVRLSLAQSIEVLEAAFDRIERFLNQRASDVPDAPDLRA